MSALEPPCSRVQLLFAATTLLVVPFGLFLAATYRAESISEYVTALRWNLAFAFVALASLAWFVAEYTRLRPGPFLLGLTLCLGLLLVANIYLPSTIQYSEVSGLDYTRLPWGENISSAVGRNGDWFHFAVLVVALVFGYLLYALVRSYRRESTSATLWMLLAVLLVVMSGIEGILVRASVIHFVHLAPFSYLAMVVVMSVALSHDTRQRLRTSESRFRSLIEQSPFSIQVLSPDGRTRLVNQAWETMWGVSAAEVADLDLRGDPRPIRKDALSYLERGLAGEVSEIPPILCERAENTQPPGPSRPRWVRGFVYPITDEASRVRELILMHEDVTDRMRVEDAIRHIATGVSAETGRGFFQQLVRSLGALFDADYTFIGVPEANNPKRITTLAVCAQGAIAPELSFDLAGTPCEGVIARHGCAYPRDVQRLFPEDRLLAELGIESYIGTPLLDSHGDPLGLIVVFDTQPLERIQQVREILEIFAARAGAELQRLHAEERMRRMAYEDFLTGLPSRAYLHERLAEAQHSEGRGALLLIDLDHFKNINDALSHEVGDEVLRAVGRRLKETAAGRALVARIGGDEFVALAVAEVASPAYAEQEAAALAESLMEALQRPLTVGERTFTVGASIGVVVFPEHGDTELDILRHADMALYRAKSQGRGNTQFYRPALQEAAASRLRLGEGLRYAIAKDQLRLQFQPQVDDTGRVCGAEALLRWHHPDMGEIPPSAFIPIAEETGLIHSIGRWVFDQACGRLGDWTRAGVPFDGHLSINVCPWQFIRPDFLSQVHDCIEQYRVDPGRLMIELTESALLYDLDDAIDKLEGLRRLGMRTSLDDFGTGYSSLAYLRDLPLDQIKIDKAFVAELDPSQEHSLVETMLSIGRHMRLEVVAEGVETVTQRDILTRLGCAHFQGFLFSEPLSEPQFIRWLQETTP